MEVSIDQLNRTYALAWKKDGEKVVCIQLNQSLYSCVDQNKFICKVKDMTRWRYFKHAEYKVLPPGASLGDRVLVENQKGISNWYFVVSVSKEQDSSGNSMGIVAI